jgi:hypothetical protein
LAKGRLTTGGRYIIQNKAAQRAAPRRNAWHRLELFAFNLALERNTFRVVFVKSFLRRFGGREDLQLVALINPYGLHNAPPL